VQSGGGCDLLEIAGSGCDCDFRIVRVKFAVVAAGAGDEMEL
jgi:hypothetical protein